MKISSFLGSKAPSLLVLLIGIGWVACSGGTDFGDFAGPGPAPDEPPVPFFEGGGDPFEVQAAGPSGPGPGQGPSSTASGLPSASSSSSGGGGAGGSADCWSC